MRKMLERYKKKIFMKGHCVRLPRWSAFSQCVCVTFFSLLYEQLSERSVTYLWKLGYVCEKGLALLISAFFPAVCLSHSHVPHVCRLCLSTPFLLRHKYTEKWHLTPFTHGVLKISSDCFLECTDVWVKTLIVFFSALKNSGAWITIKRWYYRIRYASQIGI